MAASPRSIVAHPLDLIAEGTIERGDAEPGDVIFAFHSSDLGELSDMRISGGGTWTPVDSLSGGTDWAGSEIWRKPIGASEPTSYSFEQADDDTAGTVILLVLKQADTADIVVTKADGSTAPAATPVNASGLEIRYAAGFPDNEAVFWAQLSGYSGLDVQVLGALTTAAIAVRPYVSSSAVPVRDLGPDPSDFPCHAFTILVKSAGSGSGGGGIPPTPPAFPSSTPGKGESDVRVTVHDFLTGEYRGDLHPSGLSLSKLMNEPGAWRGHLDLTNPTEAAKINEIFPSDPDDLLAGPGRLVAHTWLEEELWGIHWLHTTSTAREEGGAIGMDVMGSTLDAYPLYVALETEGELIFGDDQIQNWRDLIQHMQSTPGSNPGLGLMAGISGVVRPLIAKPGPGVTYGRILQDYARAADGYESVINPRVVDGSIIRSYEWGSPKIVGPGVHVFHEGEDGGTISSWKETRSALAGGTRWGAWGGTPEQQDATQSASPVRGALVTTAHVAAGYPIIDQRPTHPGASTSQSVVDAFVEYWAGKAAGAQSVFSFNAIIGPGSTLGPNSLGDTVQAVLDNFRYPIKADGSASFDRSMRLIGWELTPADRGTGGKDRIRLISEMEAAA